MLSEDDIIAKMSERCFYRLDYQTLISFVSGLAQEYDSPLGIHTNFNCGIVWNKVQCSDKKSIRSETTLPSNSAVPQSIPAMSTPFSAVTRDEDQTRESRVRKRPVVRAATEKIEAFLYPTAILYFYEHSSQFADTNSPLYSSIDRTWELSPSHRSGIIS